MAFPVNARYEVRVAGTTTVKAAWANAVDDALIGIYGGGKSVVGVTIDGTGNQAVTPGALTVSHAITNWQIVAKFDDTLGGSAAQRRLYMGGTAATESLFCITVNAWWNGTTSRWVADEAGLASSRAMFGADASSGVLNLYWKVAGAAPWTDVSWTAVSVQGNAGLQQLLGNITAAAGYIQASAGNVIAAGDPASDQARVKGKQFVAQGSTPTISATSQTGTDNGVGDGTGGITGTDTAGRLTVSTGAATGNGDIAVVTFNKAFANAPVVVISPTSADTSNLGWTPYVSSTTTTFKITSGTGAIKLGAGKSFGWNYHVIGI